MNKRKRMIVRAKTQMIINADTLEESGWYRHMTGENRADNKLTDLMVMEFLGICDINRVRLNGRSRKLKGR